MKMTFRWYGEGNDPIPLQYIKQIPGVSGIMGTLAYKEAGENWEKDEIKKLVDGVHAAGLECEVIESVNVHEDIKLGLPSRDEYIENYKTTIENLAEFGVKVIVYNFMPVFDWLRTDLAHVDPEDGSNSLFYDEDEIQGMTPHDIVAKTAEGSGGLTLPGWEPERLSHLDEVMEKYQGMTGEKLLENWKYFLDAIIPTCEKVGIRMACHPDDPAWDLFGIPRVYKSLEDIDRILDLNDSPAHGLCVCIGSLGSNVNNDVAAILRHVGKRGRLVASHLRNVKHFSERTFKEAPHLSRTGDLPMEEAVEAIYDVEKAAADAGQPYEVYVRPDHGRMIWGEEGRPGYPLYDRALGTQYLLGLWDATKKQKEKASN
ncbi:mannonate dehydratase [Actinobaculum suis]|uniref:Mannonate dehydratase n=1 Tax=Actinobaculum suis TaxID=1657 RepID=A0A0K9EV32_9ACTO|nr:mannonate dehydratase [Actinobaculum suis]KMY23755.1 mannonate dehydratase [Actinobaculum suis]MDY5153103.1 mannonate dehydratase [Actinobaculum suis]OCA93755.1 mannonate dehydratase [Actinobaculum suis]OCA94048.1 mannonate dehydratase [Actinobaculum suis]SDE32443.1 mannonate dehydratase [Actinobaculum suis]